MKGASLSLHALWLHLCDILETSKLEKEERLVVATDLGSEGSLTKWNRENFGLFGTYKPKFTTFILNIYIVWCLMMITLHYTFVKHIEL